MKKTPVGTRFQALFFVFILTLTLAVAGLAQQPPTQTPPQQPGPEKVAPPPEKPQAEAPEHHLSQAEAEALFKSIDEILAFVSKDTGLPIKEPVKRKLVTREEVGRFLEERMKDDKDTEKLERVYELQRNWAKAKACYQRSMAENNDYVAPAKALRRLSAMFN